MRKNFLRGKCTVQKENFQHENLQHFLHFDAMF